MTSKSNSQKAEAQTITLGMKTLSQLIKNRSVEDPHFKQYEEKLTTLEKAMQKDDRDAIIRGIDLLVLAVQRDMGTKIALTQAFEIVNTLLMDIKRPIGDPGQTYVEATQFAYAFSAMAKRIEAEEVVTSLVRRPIVPGIEHTAELIKNTLQTTDLPKEKATQLAKLVDDMLSLAPRVDTAKPHDSANQQFLATAIEFETELHNATKAYVSTTQANYIMGVMLFAWPALLCWSAPAWVVQIAAVAIGGVLYVFDTAEAKYAGANIKRFIEKIPPPGERAVRARARREAAELSPNEIRDVIDFLKRWRDESSAAFDEDLIRRINWAIDELESMIP